MKNLNVCLLAAVACTYALQAAANSLEYNLNFLEKVQKGIPLELEPVTPSNHGVKLAAVCHITDVGCTNIGFGSVDDNINLDNAAQCKDEGFGISCPYGYVPDAAQKCPYNNSFFKCRVCSHTCNSGSLTRCNSDQVETDSIRNDCNETCYTCRAKTCEEGGYTSSLNSCQKASTINFAGKTCYTNIDTKSCEDAEGGRYLTSVPENQTCSSTSYCGNTCNYNCSQPACTEGGFEDSIPDNNVCTPTPYYGRTCYKDCYQPNCSDGKYKSSVPTNNICDPVKYYGTTCYQNCYQPTCSAGGYESSIPAGKTCDSILYYGSSCYKNCQIKTCKQQLLATGNYLDDGTGIIYRTNSPSTAYVLTDTNITPMSNAKTGNTYDYIYGVTELKSVVSLCGNEPIPTITLRRAQSPYVASRIFNNIKIKFNGDYSTTGNATFDINAQSVFNRVQFLGTGSKNVTFNISGNSTTVLQVGDSFANNNGISFNAIVKKAATYGGIVFDGYNTAPKWNSVRVQDGGMGRSFAKAEINQITVNGGGSRWEVHGTTKIQNLYVENWAKFLSEANSGKLDANNVNVSGYAQLKFNYSDNNVINNLNMSNYGILKVNYYSSLIINNSLYMGGCSRMCSYTDPSNAYNGAITLQGATRTCACGGNNPSLLWSHDAWFGNSQFSRGCTQKYDANQWTCKNAGTRGKEGCGSTYDSDSFWTTCW